METLPGLWSLTPIGAVIGVIVLLYWLLASGRIITKSSHERELGLANHRGDEWKETALMEREVNKEIRYQNSKLIQANAVVEQFLIAATPSGILDKRGDNNVAG